MMNLSKYKIGDIIEIKVRAKIAGIDVNNQDAPLGLCIKMDDTDFLDREWPQISDYTIVEPDPKLLPKTYTARDFLNKSFMHIGDKEILLWKCVGVTHGTDGVSHVYIEGGQSGKTRIPQRIESVELNFFLNNFVPI
jgi:hypothetical protein